MLGVSARLRAHNGGKLHAQTSSRSSLASRWSARGPAKTARQQVTVSQLSTSSGSHHNGNLESLQKTGWQLGRSSIVCASSQKVGLSSTRGGNSLQPWSHVVAAGGGGGDVGGGGLKGTGGGGNNNDDEDDGYPTNQNEQVHPDRWKPPWKDYLIGLYCTTLCFVSKSIICWCSSSSELTAVAVDLGFLCFLGPVAWFTRIGPYQSFRHIVCSIMGTQMIYECLFNSYWLKNVIDKNTTYKGMDPAMWVHHCGTFAAALFCCFLSKGQFYKLGGYFIVVEVTTALPVAFRYALDAKKLRGERSLVLGAGMPLAFIWRTGMCSLAVQRFFKQCQITGYSNLPFWWLGGTGVVVVTMANVYWTYKILHGVAKRLTKSSSKSLGSSTESNDKQLAANVGTAKTDKM